MTVAGTFSGLRLFDNTVPDIKLQTITSAGKVANSATTANSANSANSIVARDGSGNFAAGTITATHAGDGSALTSLNGSNIGSGTVPSARLPLATAAVIGAILVGANLTITSGTLSLSGANVTGALGYTPTNKAGDTLAGFLSAHADPTSAMHLATKQYVDARAAGLDPKASVRVATTANITLSGTQTIDGVAVVAGDRVLVKNQSTASGNGIYVVAAGAWTRAGDFNSTENITSGARTYVEEGTLNGTNSWVLITTGAVTVGTTSLTFTQDSGTGQIVDGAALLKTGNQLDVQVDNSTIEVSSDALRIKAGGISNSHINASAAIADTKLATLATAGKVANSATTAVSAATANAIITRDANGRAQVATPSASADIATKGYVDSAVGGNGTVVDNEVPGGTINGTNNSFTLAHTPIAGSLRLTMGGIRLTPITHFSFSGTTITMVAGFEPMVGESFLADYRH